MAFRRTDRMGVLLGLGLAANLILASLFIAAVAMVAWVEFIAG